jgi:hypothetical protein
MASSNIEKELLELERQYWQALQNGDATTAARLSDETCFVTGAQGVGKLERGALEGMVRASKWKLESFDIKNPIARALGDDVGVIAYNVHEVLDVEGERVELDAADSSTWVRRGGQWVCALHTESLAGDPFGRDKP